MTSRKLRKKVITKIGKIQKLIKNVELYCIRNEVVQRNHDKAASKTVRSFSILLISRCAAQKRLYAKALLQKCAQVCDTKLSY